MKCCRIRVIEELFEMMSLLAHRGNIMDRNGQALAISTPVQSLWLNPREIIHNPQAWKTLTSALESIEVNTDVLWNRIQDNAQREFLYIKRRLPPAEVQSILDLKIRGVYSQEEYKRFYPLGEVAVHLVGLTNSDDVGQEGLELAYEDWLQGKPGSKQVLKDRRGGIIREVKINSVAEPGNDLVLSIDSRIQYLAYKALKEEVTRRYAKAGTAVVLNVETGEVLAMVNQPSYNPNNRISLDDNEMRNRAIVDLLEPGSTVKPFTITAALESGLFDTSSIIDTNPGYIQVDGSTKKDPVNYKKVDLKKLLPNPARLAPSSWVWPWERRQCLMCFPGSGLVQQWEQVFPVKHPECCQVSQDGVNLISPPWLMAMAFR